MNRLILIRGLPGSGKTTLALQLYDAHRDEIRCAVYAADDFFYGTKRAPPGWGSYKFDRSKLKDAHAQCQRRAFGDMSDGREVIIVHNTFTQMWEMEPYITMAKEYGYLIQVIECKGNFGSVHGVPDEAIDRMRARWEEYSDE